MILLRSCPCTCPSIASCPGAADYLFVWVRFFVGAAWWCLGRLAYVAALRLGVGPVLYVRGG